MRTTTNDDYITTLIYIYGIYRIMFNKNIIKVFIRGRFTM
jgi:hypothetical protein